MSMMPGAGGQSQMLMLAAVGLSGLAACAIVAFLVLNTNKDPQPKPDGNPTVEPTEVPILPWWTGGDGGVLPPSDTLPGATPWPDDDDLVFPPTYAPLDPGLDPDPSPGPKPTRRPRPTPKPTPKPKPKPCRATEEYMPVCAGTKLFANRSLARCAGFTKVTQPIRIGNRMVCGSISPCKCGPERKPVCALNKMYTNACLAQCDGATSWKPAIGMRRPHGFKCPS